MDSASPIAQRTAERPTDRSSARFGFAMFYTFKLAETGNRDGWNRGTQRDRLPRHPSATGHGRAS